MSFTKTYTVTSKESTEKNLNKCIDASQYNFRVQEMRLIASLIEAGWAVIVTQTQLSSLKPTKFFHPYQVINNNNINKNIHVLDLPIFVDHAKPSTQVGNIFRPLFFPEWLANISKQSTLNKDILISFSGNITAHRLIESLKLINSYPSCLLHKISHHLIALSELKQKRLTSRLSYKYLNLVNKYTEIQIINSDLGRKIPGKIFDKNYWDILCRSQFVFCPSGDFGWTYRFYEAMLCGACPIVERKDLDFAQDFFYVTLGDPLPTRSNILPSIENNWEKTFDLLCGISSLSNLHDG